MEQPLIFPPVKIGDEALAAFIGQSGLPLILLDGLGRIVARSQGCQGLALPEDGSLPDLFPELEPEVDKILERGGLRLVWVDKIKALVSLAPAQWEEGSRGLLAAFIPGETLGAKLSALPLFQELLLERDAIIEASSQGLWVCDPEGRVKRVNQSSLKLNGVTFSEIAGKTMLELEARGDFSGCATLEAIRTKKPVSKLVYLNRTGIKVLSTASPVFDSSGRFLMVVGTETDIGHEEALHRSLRESGADQGWERPGQDEFRDKCASFDFVAKSKAMHSCLTRASKAAETDSTILMTGESGSGKTRLAQIIHLQSQAKAGPFLALNCAAIPDTLLESELFGYEKGSFTGAKAEGKPGLFELADGGTLFLDEISELAWPAQAKLLKVLEDKTIMAVGAKKYKKINVRLIAATNRDLGQMASEKLFRTDLFYRLNVITLNIPPLRQRRECLIFMIHHYLNYFQDKFNKKITLKPGAMKMMLSYSWPGNVRELVNVCERLVVLGDGNFIDQDDLPLEVLAEAAGVTVQATPAAEAEALNPPCDQPPDGKSGPDFFARPLEQQLADFERSILEKALNLFSNQVDLGRILGLSQPSVSRRLKKYGLLGAK